MFADEKISAGYESRVTLSFSARCTDKKSSLISPPRAAEAAETFLLSSTTFRYYQGKKLARRGPALSHLVVSRAEIETISLSKLRFQVKYLVGRKGRGCSAIRTAIHTQSKHSIDGRTK